jgi:hypothetical protein
MVGTAGCSFFPLIGLSLSGLSPERIPAVSGLFNFTRITAESRPATSRPVIDFLFARR